MRVGTKGKHCFSTYKRKLHFIETVGTPPEPAYQTLLQPAQLHNIIEPSTKQTRLVSSSGEEQGVYLIMLLARTISFCTKTQKESGPGF